MTLRDFTMTISVSFGQVAGTAPGYEQWNVCCDGRALQSFGKEEDARSFAMFLERNAPLVAVNGRAVKIDALTKAQHDAEFIAADLQAALKQASAIEALVILPLIRQARELREGLAALESALSAKE
jgi:hypothetical protein